MEDKDAKEREWNVHGREGRRNLHNLVHIPQNRVGMVVLGWVKPEVDPLLPVTLPTGEHIGLQDVGLVGPVPQELKVYLIML